MANTAKYKINALAKDLNLKSKDIVDVLTEKGIDGKTHMAALEDDELNLLFDHFSAKSTVPDIGAYLTPKPKAKKPEVPTKAAPEQETAPTVAPIKAAPVEQPAAEKSAVVAEGSAPTPPEKPLAESSNEPKQATEQVTQAMPGQTQSAPQEQAKPVGTAPTQPRVPQTGSPQTGYQQQTGFQRPNTGDRFQRPDGQRPPYQNNNDGQRPPYQNNGNGQRPPYQNNNDGQRPPYQNNANGQRPPYQNTNGTQRPPYQNNNAGQRPPYQNDGQRPPYNNQPRPAGATGGYQPRPGGFTPRPQGGPGGDQSSRPPFQRNADNGPLKTDTYANVQFTKDGFVSTGTQRPSGPQSGNKFGNKPGQKSPGFRPNAGGNKVVGKEDDSPSVRQPSVRPIYDKDGRARSRYAGERKADGSEPSVVTDNGVRLVDIREREVDLSKYDERLDSLVPDAVSQEELQRSKKPVSKAGSSGRINRNESAARDFSGGTTAKGKFNNNKRNTRQRPQQQQQQDREPVKKFTGPITLPEEIMISDLAAKLKITTGEVIKKLLLMGIGMGAVGANKLVDYDTAYLLADEMGITADKEVVLTIEDRLFAEEEEDKESDLKPRSPVVVVMGHVDHGKTSLLDAIRDTNVTEGEAGGITQHIGAYRVRINDRDISFLDTPGHEAFTAMRARGAQVTDIAILVVAADDGIMPQTIEAINHAKAAGVAVIVAINKMDKPGANAEAVKQDLTKYELVPEEWGGDTICVPVSAKKRQGIEELLEMVLLVADMKELKANPNRPAKGIVIEAKLDRGRGPVATVLVQNGTLHAGDVVLAGTAIGHVRVMSDDKGNTLKGAGPSVPVEITGLSEVPGAGDEFRVVADEKMARALVEQRKSQEKEEAFKANSKVSLDALFEQISEGVKELALIVKADVQGSAEAVKASLEKLSNDEIKVRVIHSGVGGIKESDVMLADASNAIIIGFNVRPDKGAMDSAERQKVDIRTYRIIYECIEEITAAINGMLAPEFKEVVLGRAEVRQTIHVPNVGMIAGSYVLDGKITRNAKIRVVRDSVVIFEDKIGSLRRFKDDIREVAQGYECGIGLERFNDIKENDILEAFIMEEIKREI